MNFSNNKLDPDLVAVSPMLGENAPALIDLWKAQMVWISLVGLPVPPSPPDEAPAKLKDFLK
jgi:hypothetical protein